MLASVSVLYFRTAQCLLVELIGDKLVISFAIFVLFLVLEMASLTATEPALCPGTIPAAESVVPACMFAPDMGCADDPSSTEGFEDGRGTNGESADHVDLSNKVGLAVNCTC